MATVQWEVSAGQDWVSVKAGKTAGADISTALVRLTIDPANTADGGKQEVFKALRTLEMVLKGEQWPPA